MSRPCALHGSSRFARDRPPHRKPREPHAGCDSGTRACSDGTSPDRHDSQLTSSFIASSLSRSAHNYGVQPPAGWRDACRARGVTAATVGCNGVLWTTLNRGTPPSSRVDRRWVGRPCWDKNPREGQNPARGFRRLTEATESPFRSFRVLGVLVHVCITHTFSGGACGARLAQVRRVTRGPTAGTGC